MERRAGLKRSTAMGCLIIIILGAVSAGAIFIFGYPLWLMIVLGLLWLSAVVYSAFAGHHGFGGGGNTDLNIVIAGMLISVAIVIPRREAQKPCNQVRTALTKLAEAENQYFSGHKTFTKDLGLLNLKLKPEIDIYIFTADEKLFIASASHGACDKDKDGKPDVLLWDSARGGLQQ